MCFGIYFFYSAATLKAGRIENSVQFAVCLFVLKSFSLSVAEETERLKPYEESTFEEKIAPGGGDGEFDTAASERYAPSHFSERYPQSTYSERYAPSQHSERYVGSQPPPTDEYMQDDHNR